MKAVKKIHKKKLILALVLIAIVIPIASIYALQSERTNKITPEPPEFAQDALDTAINYILMTHEGLGDLQVPSSWETRTLTPEGFCGSSTLQFTGDGWTANITYPIVLKPTFTIEIEHTGEVYFLWKGTVDQDGNVVEIDIYAPNPTPCHR